MIFVNTDISDEEVKIRAERFGHQTKEALSRELQNMIEQEEEWVPKEWDVHSLFLLWKWKDPEIFDPKVLRGAIVERCVLLPNPEWGTTLYEYVKEEKLCHTVWSLPEKIIIESGTYKNFDWDEISTKSIEQFMNKSLRKYVVRRNRVIQARIINNNKKNK